MNNVDLNNILKRNNIKNNILKILNDINNDIISSKGIYLYGENGIGKTQFINNILINENYDIIFYDSFDIRNKNLIEGMQSSNISNKNIMSLFDGNIKKKVIVMDDINAMNNGDKGGINTLIKLIRQKKTKKQKKEVYTTIPVICIGNTETDKKIKEIMKVSYVIKLDKPTNDQIHKIIFTLIPDIDDSLVNKLIYYINGNLNKLDLFINLYNKDKNIIKYIDELYINSSNNSDAKEIVNDLFNNLYDIKKHNLTIPETERTIVGLLWHENIIDLNKDINVYLNILDNLCFSDYIDRIIFQKQIWELNEMSSLIKTFLNSYIYHKNKTSHLSVNNIRFTKVLTKYSTEFNNYIFIQKICKYIGLDKKDMYLFFYDLLQNLSHDDIVKLMENYQISKLDIKRIDKLINLSDTFNEKLIDENLIDENLIDE